jgi:hypothetical protein
MARHVNKGHVEDEFFAFNSMRPACYARFDGLEQKAFELGREDLF